jgi:putative glutamine amidotransferase
MVDPAATPIVAVSASTRHEDGRLIHWCSERYINAVADAAGALPLIVPNLGERIDIDRLVSGVDGLLLTGDLSNVYPPLYGAADDPAAEPYDHPRDATVMPLIRAAIRFGLPLLAICRGIQELNVALGGTLVGEVQDIDGRSDHRAVEHDDTDVRYGIRHEVHFTPGSALAAILGGPAIHTNTLHRQAIGRLADGLIVEGAAEDGTIEAVRVAGAAAFAYGVQWHPEYWATSDPASNRLFRAFGDAMRAHISGRLAAAE